MIATVEKIETNELLNMIEISRVIDFLLALMARILVVKNDMQILMARIRNLQIVHPFPLDHLPTLVLQWSLHLLNRFYHPRN